MQASAWVSPSEANRLHFARISYATILKASKMSFLLSLPIFRSDQFLMGVPLPQLFTGWQSTVILSAAKNLV